jgi:SNF2 family DNA or RNA helicase
MSNVSPKGFVKIEMPKSTKLGKIAMEMEARYSAGEFIFEWWRFVEYVKILLEYGIAEEEFVDMAKEIMESVRVYKDVEWIENDKRLKWWQADALRFLWGRWLMKGVAQRGGMLHLDMGLGKTFIILKFLEEAAKRQDRMLSVIVVPAYLRENWKAEIDKWWKNVDANVIVTSGRKTPIQLRNNIPNIIITSYTSLSAYIHQLTQIVDVLVLDESHKIKNYKAQRTRNVLFMKPRFTIESTGTLFLNYPHEVWSQYERIVKDTYWYWSSHMKYWDWTFRYCYVMSNPFNGAKIIKGINKHSAWELQARLAPIHLRMSKEEIIGIDKPIITLHKVNVKYDISEEEYEKIIKSVEADKIPAQHYTQKLRKAALEKIPYIRELVKDLVEQHKKVIVFTWHVKVSEVLEEELKKHMNVVAMYSSDNYEKRWDKIQKFKKGEADVFIGSLGVASEGLNLQEATDVVFVQLPYTSGMFRQAIDRARRMKEDGTFNIPTVHVVLGKSDDVRVGDIELALWNILKRKSNAYELVFNG